MKRFFIFELVFFLTFFKNLDFFSTFSIFFEIFKILNFFRNFPDFQKKNRKIWKNFPQKIMISSEIFFCRANFIKLGMYFDVARRDLSIGTTFRSIRDSGAKLWSNLGQKTCYSTILYYGWVPSLGTRPG